MEKTSFGGLVGETSGYALILVSEIHPSVEEIKNVVIAGLYLITSFYPSLINYFRNFG
jgi:hypothetical protein